MAWPWVDLLHLFCFSFLIHPTPSRKHNELECLVRNHSLCDHLYLEHLHFGSSVMYKGVILSVCTAESVWCNGLEHWSTFRFGSFIQTAVSGSAHLSILIFTVPQLTVGQSLTIKFDIWKMKVLWISHTHVKSLFLLALLWNLKNDFELRPVTFPQTLPSGKESWRSLRLVKSLCHPEENRRGERRCESAIWREDLGK